MWIAKAIALCNRAAHIFLAADTVAEIYSWSSTQLSNCHLRRPVFSPSFLAPFIDVNRRLELKHTCLLQQGNCIRLHYWRIMILFSENYCISTGLCLLRQATEFSLFLLDPVFARQAISPHLLCVDKSRSSCHSGVFAVSH